MIKKRNSFLRFHIIPLLATSSAIWLWMSYGQGSHWWWIMLIFAIALGHYLAYYTYKFKRKTTQT